MTEQCRARRMGKSQHMKAQASAVLDSGKKVLYATLSTDLVIERINNVDFIVNEDGTTDIEGNGLLKND